MDMPLEKPFRPWPFFSEDEIAACVRVLTSGKVNYWTGQECRAFEIEFAAAVGCKHAVAMSNGTTALEACILALEIPEGSEIITTPRTFIASASCIVARKCIPVMADLDPVSGNISAETISRVLTPKTKAIIAVHLGGWPCDMDPIMALAERHGLKVIEDCAQANGATYKGRPVGSLGHAAAFSFCQDKIISTGGEGGMVTTQKEDVWRRAWEYKDHGKSYEAVYHREHNPRLRWRHEPFGTNWRMTEFQAAIGRIQLRKLPEWTATRRNYMGMLMEAFRRIPSLRVPNIPDEIGHAAYRAYAFVELDRLKEGWTRDRIMQAINSRGIPCLSGSCSEIYLEKALLDAHFGPETRLPVAHAMSITSLAFLVHPTLEECHIKATTLAVEEVFAEATIKEPA